jgi:hypothetical protein
MVRVQVIWKSASGIRRITDAMLEDISTSGAGLRIGNPVSVGCSVEMPTRKGEPAVQNTGSKVKRY